jgi:excisionase family DNA binding protein
MSKNASTALSEPLLLDIHGAARLLSATPWAIRSLLWNGEIPFVKIGRKHLISPDDLRSYIASKKVLERLEKAAA